MLDQFLGALLFLFGFGSGGNVRGDSTPSANIASVSSVLKTDIRQAELRFLERQKKAVTQWETKRASFSASLKTIRTEKKKTQLETVQNRLNEINKNQTTRNMATLKKLNQAVGEIEKRAQLLSQESGKDSSDVISKLNTANAAISDAIESVTLQAEKTYVMIISSEANVKKDFGVQRSALASDLKNVRDDVHNARKKVGDTLKALKNMTGTQVKILIEKVEPM